MSTSIASPANRPAELRDQTVLVMGGSAGIGLATAIRARHEGADVILTARNAERLEAAGRQLDARRDQLRATLPIRRVVQADDVARPVVHIMLNTALTGATFDIDGGQQFVE
ncbi:MAG: SDR family NAD(P)-dependent oxidoreductase [Solirubrobacteraceae bacterium]